MDNVAILNINSGSGFFIQDDSGITNTTGSSGAVTVAGLLNKGRNGHGALEQGET